MAKSSPVSTFSFGGGGSVFSSKNFITTDPELTKKLGTEIARGEFTSDSGLVGFDTTSAFTSQPGIIDTSPEQSPPKPSTRPYIWKYNK